MDLILLILLLALVGFVLHLILSHIPMPSEWATTLKIFAVVLLVVYLLKRLGFALPNVL